MDSKSVGKTIASLRKKNHLTQRELAEKLGVSDKSVSRWESGQGFPDVTLFPLLANLFGVSIDRLMMGGRKGIALAGNILVDIIKTIQSYPKCGMLANISDISYSVGGCVPNTAINLAKIDCTLPISAIGKVGNDENGRFVISQMVKNGINTDHVTTTEAIDTSFTDVMSIPSGERTFFHQKGANAVFCPDDVDFDTLNCDILHTGYLLLLDRFDAPDEKYGTVMAKYLHDAQERGIRTSIDMVSNNTADYEKTIIPALKYCNFVIINEIECCGIFNLNPENEDGSPNKENIKTAMRKVAECGVKDKIVVHCKETSFALNIHNGKITEVPSLKIPKEEIKGSTGAGDAFCAGCLYGIYHGLEDKELLEFASSAAACNLFSPNAIDGMRNKNEILKLAEKYGRLA